MSKSIASRIASCREESGLSLQDLAEKADYPEAFLERIESGVVEPELGCLVRLARALNVPLRTFMDDILSPDPYIVRERELKTQLTADAASTSSQQYYSLGKGKAGRGMEPFFIKLGPCSEDHPCSTHEGEEFIVVVSGTVRLQYGQSRYELGPGDSAYYSSDVPHSVCAAGESATLYAVMRVPD